MALPLTTISFVVPSNPSLSLFRKVKNNSLRLLIFLFYSDGLGELFQLHCKAQVPQAFEMMANQMFGVALIEGSLAEVLVKPLILYHVADRHQESMGHSNWEFERGN